MTRAAILPGTYDPITCGHTSLACRAAALFGRAVVVVMNNTEKRTLFSFEERLALARAAFAGRADVEVVGCAGLLADFAADYGDAVLVKGVRDARDFAYEAEPCRNQPAARRGGDAAAARRPRPSALFPPPSCAS